LLEKILGFPAQRSCHSPIAMQRQSIHAQQYAPTDNTPESHLIPGYLSKEFASKSYSLSRKSKKKLFIQI
jgi:hypothetical protein